MAGYGEGRRGVNGRRGVCNGEAWWQGGGVMAGRGGGGMVVE